MRRFSLLLVLLLGCSSSDGGSSPTPSAGGSGGEAGSSNGRVCTPGSTQACVGPAACNGGQSCAFDGSGWSPCDCGSAGAGQAGGSAQAGQSQGGSAQAGKGGSGPAGAAQGGAGSAQAGAAQGGAGSGPAGAAGQGGGAAGMAATGDDSVCLTMKGQQCQTCCNTNHAKSKMDYSTDLVTCACFAACVDKCTVACTGADDPGCNTCMIDRFKSGACTFDNCTTQDCMDLNACVTSCPD
jgi:hypothetical protein